MTDLITHDKSRSNIIYLNFLLCPPPHVLEHSVQSLQSVHSGQVCWLHSSMTSKGPLQGLSSNRLLDLLPSSSASTHLRVFFLKPPPHVSEQLDHSDQSSNSGHFLLLHVETSDKGSWQGLSYSLSVRELVEIFDIDIPHSRDRSRFPPLHETLHSLHAVHGPSSEKSKVKFK